MESTSERDTSRNEGIEGQPSHRTKGRKRTKSAIQTGTSETGKNGNSASAGKTGESTPDLVEEAVIITEEIHPPHDATPSISLPEIPTLTNSIIFLTLLDGLVTMAFGPKCAMTKDERKMMSEPLERMLKRLPNYVADKMSVYVDPILFVMGLVAWGSRIARIKREENETKQMEEQKRPQARSEETRGPDTSIVEETANIFEKMSAPEYIHSNFMNPEPMP